MRLSHQVTHRADIWALHDLGATAVIGCTACGAVDPSLELGSLVVFDDLHFASNRLPDGSLCTFFVAPGDPARGHWILHGGPFSEGVRAALLAAAAESGHAARDGGAYGHVDGPRFNTPTEIAQLAGCGVVAVSQTGGPETVLCGELELPFALVGFVTDYANEVVPGEPTAGVDADRADGPEHRGVRRRARPGGQPAVGRAACPRRHHVPLRAGVAAVAATPAVVVMAGAARARPELRELLGDERAGAVERLLVARATAWAATVSAGRVSTAADDEGVADALERTFAGAQGGPVLVVWPVLPRWRPEHAAAVLDDLAAGCDVSVAPVFDGGLYLLALARIIPALLALPAAGVGQPRRDRTGAGAHQRGRGAGRAWCAPSARCAAPPTCGPPWRTRCSTAELRALLTG